MPSYASNETLVSATQSIPLHSEFPRHIAIVMDGNGRWARLQMRPHVAGHRRGLETVRRVVRLCMERGIPNLTLFAFSSENWRRPAEEVPFLMKLFLRALHAEILKLHENNIRLRVIGDISRFNPALQQAIEQAQSLTADNTGLNLNVAANYGGRWDILQAVRQMLSSRPELAGNFTEQDLARYLCLGDLPEPDLFIRTGGEQRVSNFLLWQLAYTEYFFTDCLWPDFDTATFETALASFRKRERRFGRTGEQTREARAAG